LECDICDDCQTILTTGDVNFTGFGRCSNALYVMFWMDCVCHK